MRSKDNTVIYLFKLKLDKKFSGQLKDDLDAKLSMDLTAVSGTSKTTLVKIRKGQQKFKKNLSLTMDSCPFTNISSKILLRASHIKPWKASTDSERLDGYNGLLLTPTYDTLFDAGLISFENNGALLISPCLDKDTQNKLSLTEGKVYTSFITNKRIKYLDYHRSNVFIIKLPKD